MKTNPKHHPFGPSTMRRRELCPASLRLEDGLPALPAGPDAERGTRIHALVAKWIEAKKAPEPETEEEELALKCFQYWRRETAIEGSVIDAPEQRLSYCVVAGQPETELYFGTCDYVGAFLINGKLCGLIIDWKTGYSEIDPAPDNIQGAAYALAAFQTYKLDRCEVHFYNPTLNRASSHVFTDADALAEHIMRVHNLCLAPDTPPVPGEDQCRYCKAFQQAACPAVKKKLEVIAETASTLEGVIPTLPDEKLVEFFEKAKLVAKLEGVAEAEIKRRCEDSGVCAGYRIKETSGGFEITDIPKAFELADGLDEARFLGCCKLSESQLKKAWAKAQVNGGEYKTLKEAEFAFASVFGGLRCPKPPKRTLVKEDTKALN